MRRLWIVAAGLAGLLGGCHENLCVPVVERSCSDLRAKAQQGGGTKAPTPEELCPQLKLDENKLPLLAKVCGGEEVQESYKSSRAKTPLEVAGAMCDGMKLHYLSPTVDELTECNAAEVAHEKAAEDRKKEQEEAAKKKAEEAKNPPPKPAPAPVSAPASAASTPASAPAPAPGAPAAPAPAAPAAPAPK
jgi:hypothetical protein